MAETIGDEMVGHNNRPEIVAFLLADTELEAYKTSLVLYKEIELWDKEVAVHRAKNDVAVTMVIRENSLNEFPPVQPIT